MSTHQSDKHGPADEALKDDRHQSSAGTRHDGRPQDDPESGGDVAVVGEVLADLGLHDQIEGGR